MAENRTPKTWEEFWAELLFVRFHEDNLRLWELNGKRAQWVLEQCPRAAQPRILDLGCGIGVLDILLARAGAQVMAVDRMESVLRHAAKMARDEAITFACHDLRQLRLPPASFDIVLIFGLAGLMSRAEDSALIAKAREWLAPDGCLLIDCQLEPAEPTLHWSREFSDGTLDFSVTYDSQTRLLQMEPTFQTTSGTVIELYDPYDSGKPHLTGICRYLYLKEELADILTANGLLVHQRAHIFDDDYLLVGKNGSS